MSSGALIRGLVLGFVSVFFLGRAEAEFRGPFSTLSSPTVIDCLNQRRELTLCENIPGAPLRPIFINPQCQAYGFVHPSTVTRLYERLRAGFPQRELAPAHVQCFLRLYERYYFFRPAPPSERAGEGQSSHAGGGERQSRPVGTARALTSVEARTDAELLDQIPVRRSKWVGSQVILGFNFPPRQDSVSVIPRGTLPPKKQLTEDGFEWWPVMFNVYAPTQRRFRFGRRSAEDTSLRVIAYKNPKEVATLCEELGFKHISSKDELVSFCEFGNKPPSLDQIQALAMSPNVDWVEWHHPPPPSRPTKPWLMREFYRPKATFYVVAKDDVAAAARACRRLGFSLVGRSANRSGSGAYLICGIDNPSLPYSQLYQLTKAPEVAFVADESN